MITYLLFQYYKRHKRLKKSLQQRVRSTTRIIIIIIITIALKSNVTQSKIKKNKIWRFEYLSSTTLWCAPITHYKRKSALADRFVQTQWCSKSMENGNIGVSELRNP